LGFRAELYRLGDNLIYVLDNQVQRCRRGADVLCTPRAHFGHLRAEHEGGAAQREFGVDGLAIGSVHNPTLLKSESLLIKGSGRFHVGDTKSGRDGSVVFLVQWINLFGHLAGPFRKYSTRAVSTC
jgi:hypothetical protein